MTNLLKNLEWRYAAKKMDASHSVSKEKVDFILEAIRLTASSLVRFNIHAIKFGRIKKLRKCNAECIA